MKCQNSIWCTKCINYNICPQNIEISRIFSYFKKDSNGLIIFSLNIEKSEDALPLINKINQYMIGASLCNDCKICIMKCSLRLPIPQLLKEFTDYWLTNRRLILHQNFNGKSW